MDYLKRFFANRRTTGRANEIKTGSTIKFKIKVDDEATANRIEEILLSLKQNNKINIPEKKADDCNAPLLKKVVDTKTQQMKSPPQKRNQYDEIEVANLGGQKEVSKHKMVSRKAQKPPKKKRTVKNFTNRMTSALNFTKKRLFECHKKNDTYVPVVYNKTEEEEHIYEMPTEPSPRITQRDIKNKRNGELFLKYLNTRFMDEVREHVLNKIQRRYNMTAISTPDVRYFLYYPRRTPYGTWPIRRNKSIKVNKEQIKSSYKIIDEKFSLVKRKELKKLLVHVEKVGKIDVVQSTEPLSYYKQEKFTYVLHYMLKNEQYFHDDLIYEGEEILV